MRSSKSRSRNKSNRNRSVGNIVNRVFDSSGPEGKVRGTPQQIIDKYTQLARDAQLGNDRVAFENFQQHGEHYQRMLNEAQREQEARREEHERQNRERQSDRDRGQQGGGQQGGGQRDAQRQGDGGQRPGGDQPEDPGQSPQPDTLGPTGDDSSGLVETPETKGETAPRKPARKPRSRKPSKPKGEGENGDGTNGQSDNGDGGGSSGSTEAAE